MNTTLIRQTTMISRRAFHNSATRHGFFKYNPVGGVAGSNLPFEIKNRWGLTFKMAAFIGLPMAYPFWLLRRILLQG